MLNFCHDPALSSWQEANARIILNLKHRRAAAKTNKGVWTWRLACVTARLAKHASVCWESVRQAKLGCFSQPQQSLLFLTGPHKNKCWCSEHHVLALLCVELLFNVTCKP